MRHIQAGILTQASSAVLAFPGIAPVTYKNRSTNTATALCGIHTRFPFQRLREEAHLYTIQYSIV